MARTAIKWQVVAAGGAYAEVDEERYCLSVEALVTDPYNRFAWWVDFATGEGEHYDDVRVVASGLEVSEIAAKRAAQKAFRRIKARKFEVIR